MGFEFRILGPLEVRLDGTPVQIGGPRQRALLAMLLLSANRVVSRDRLIDELLPDAPAQNADHQLRVQVSRLRRALSPNGSQSQRLLTRAPGYLFEVEPGELDLHWFEQLLADGDAALAQGEFGQAAQTLREAESLWRGRPLADLEFEPFARVDVERLEDLRLVALEQRIEAELALGRHGMLVPQLEAAVTEHPLRERLRGQLMLALYRCGRQAEALEAYRTARAHLSEELALEPSPALQQLERSILRQEDGLNFGGPVATEVASPPLPLLQSSPSNKPSGAPREASPRRGLLLGAVALGIAAIAAVVVLVASGRSRPRLASANSVGMIDTRGGTLRAVVPAGGPPGGIAIGEGAAWVTDPANSQLLQIDPRTRAVERVPVGHGPQGVAAGGGEVWVVNQLDRTVSEINPRALRQVGSFSVGNGAEAVAFGFGAVWVTNVIDDTVSRIDPATGGVKTIPLGGQPGGIAVGADGVWVASASTGQLLLVDPRTDQVSQQKEVGGSPAGVAVGAGSVWVTNNSERSVDRFNPSSGSLTHVNVGRAPVGVTYGAGSAWVADSLDGTVARIDPKSNSVQLIRIGSAPDALAVHGRALWATVLAGPAAHRGGTVRLAEGPQFASTGSSLDPAQFAGVSQWQMLSMTNDGLVTYRRVGGLAGSTVVPDLATSLPAPTDNGRVYTFQVRRGIRYSNGEPVRPADFRHAIERIFELKNVYAEGFYTGLVGARACVRAPAVCSLAAGVVTNDEAGTVTFHLMAPDPDFLYKLAFPWADAVPAGTPGRDLGRVMPPATGPYMTSSITPGHGVDDGHPLAFDTWTLVRNPHFREWSHSAQPEGYPDRIVLSQGESPASSVTDVQKGRLDVALPVPSGRLTGLAAHDTAQFHSEPVGATFAPVLNTRVAPFNHVSVRRAFNYAIDRARIVRLAGGPLAAQSSCQILPPTLAGYEPYCPYTLDPSSAGAWKAPDLARARRLVNASGTRGMKVTLLVQPDDPTNPTAGVAPYLASVLDQIGYRASTRVSDDLYRTVANSRRHIQIGWFNWQADYPAPSDFIVLLLACHAFIPGSATNLNEAEFCDPKIDRAVSQAQELQAVNPGAASTAWSQIDRRITDQAPWLALYNPRQNILTSSRLGNYQYHPFFLVLPDQLWVR